MFEMNAERSRLMAESTKIVKGGFRATLALIISIIALLVAILAYSSTMHENQLNARIKDLRATMDKMKSESSEQLTKLRDETAKALERMGQAVKKEDGGSTGGPVK
jgi:cell division protein FtsL